jgi:hypothetical protein
MPIWDMIQAGFASAQACQDEAYLIENEELIGEYKNWMLNTPTTADRVRTPVSM